MNYAGSDPTSVHAIGNVEFYPIDPKAVTSVQLTGNQTIAGVKTFSDPGNFNSGAQAILVGPGTQDRAYIGFAARTASPTTRTGYIGFPAAANNEFSMINETSGGPVSLISNNGNINLNAGTGVMAVVASRVSLGAGAVNPPTFNTTSSGSKITLYEGMGPSSTGYAIGMEPSNMWFGASTTATGFKWYGGTTLAATLTGLGNLTLVGTATAASFIGSGSGITGVVHDTGNETIGGAKSFTGAVTAANGGGGLMVGPGSADHAYIQLYARTATPSTRTGYLGFGSAATTTLTLINEISTGALTLATTGNGTISLSAGTGNVNVTATALNVGGNPVVISGPASTIAGIKTFSSSVVIDAGSGFNGIFSSNSISFSRAAANYISATANSGTIVIRLTNSTAADVTAVTFTQSGGVATSTFSGNVNGISTLTATAFSGSGASLTSIPAAELTGTAPIGVIPTGTTSTTVALGNHGHALTDANITGILPIAQIPTGTTGTTVALGNHLHTGVYEPVISAGSAGQYWRYDKTWATLNVAAVSGAAPLASPTFTGTITGAAMTLTGSAAISGNLTVTGPLLTVGATYAGASGLEIGRTDGTASTPFVDFHSGATATDFDARIIATGGTGTNGGGTLTLQAASIAFTGTAAGVAVTTTATTNSLNTQRFLFTTGSEARPTGTAYVEWVGPVTPVNAINGDTWVDTP